MRTEALGTVNLLQVFGREPTLLAERVGLLDEAFGLRAKWAASVIWEGCVSDPLFQFPRGPETGQMGDTQDCVSSVKKSGKMST